MHLIMIKAIFILDMQIGSSDLTTDDVGLSAV